MFHVANLTSPGSDNPNDWAPEGGGGFTRIHARRRPIVGGILNGPKCGGVRSIIMEEIGRVFPVHSLGECQNNLGSGARANNNFADDSTDAGSTDGDTAAATAGTIAPPREDDGSPEAQAALSKYMFFLAMEAGECPGRTASKLWDVLSRGSIPIYFGSDDVYDYLPDPAAIIDVKKFKNAAQLGEYLRKVASEPAEFERLRAWRKRDPQTWSPGFLRLIDARSSDVRDSLCGLLNRRRDDAMEVAYDATIKQRAAAIAGIVNTDDVNAAVKKHAAAAAAVGRAPVKTTLTNGCNSFEWLQSWRVASHVERAGEVRERLKTAALASGAAAERVQEAAGTEVDGGGALGVDGGGGAAAAAARAEANSVQAEGLLTIAEVEAAASAEADGIYAVGLYKLHTVVDP
jgi:hypothetical protein